ncbi:MAG TPA: Fe-S cluster assembly protein SufD [Planctomycetota bacterium]|nr:Fe-S cluster assembly protein SufD [Planctomycetota bacterium]
MNLTAASVLSPEAIKARSANEPGYLFERRLKALDAFLTTPMPGRTDEIWRRVEFGAIDFEASAQRAPFDGLQTMNGLGSTAQSKNVFWGTPEAAAKSVSSLLERYWNTTVFVPGVPGIGGAGGKFHYLNQALWDCGYVLHVPKGVAVEAPLHSTFRTRPGQDGIFPHNLIVVEEGGSATVIEEYLPGAVDSSGLCCPQTEIVLHKNASLRYILLQTSGPQTVYIGAHHSHQYGDSRMTNVSAHLGGRLSKAFVATKMLEPGGHAYLSGLYYGTDQQRIHMDTFQHHVAPNCTTDLMFKGALDHKARAVYRGMIRLEPGAQKTDAYQQNRTLLLSDDARVDSIPGLEILANDVRCTHGATAGQIDPTILFYLMSRGLTKFRARKMIMDGFFEEVMLRFGLKSVIEPLRERIDGKIGEE